MKRQATAWRFDPRAYTLRAEIGRCYRSMLTVAMIGCVCGALTSSLMAQSPVGAADGPQKVSAPEKEDLAPAPAKVDVKPVARDEEIRTRLQSVLDATGWFTDPQVEVEEGVVFLNGRAETDELKKWAGDLARNTQDVVAVANRMEVLEPSVWDFSPAWSGLLVLWRDFIRSLPFFLFGLLILALSAGAGVLATRGARAFLRRRVRANLLRNVIARGMGVLVFLFGVYIILRVSGLTQLALTVVGGTGLIGLAVGIAFRDITENFLASIFLSMQRPFETGDLVEVTGVTGYVQQLNVRTTILMTLDGNLVQIPNATVYKSNLRNFTTNANRREDFVVGIGYDDSINEAQEIARKVLADHPAVLNDPEPSVLADSLGTVDGQPARLLLAQRPRTQLAESAVVGDPAGETRLSATRHLDARRGPRGRLSTRHPRHHARRETGGDARCRAGQAAPCSTAARRTRCGVHESRRRVIQRSRRHQGTGPAGPAVERRGESVEGSFRHSARR